MKLTSKQLAIRNKSIGGSDAPIIMKGDWLELWQVKVGLRSPADLSDVLPVQMGIWTEPHNIAWFERKVGRVVQQPSHTFYHPLLPFMHAHLDGEVKLDEGMAVFQAKHVNPFVTFEDVAEDYYAQLQHEMEVTGHERAILSVFFGNTKWDWRVIERDEPYVKLLLETEQKFWDCVRDGVEPVASMTGIKKVVNLSQLKTVKMHQNNEWVDAEQIYLKTRDQALMNAAAIERLKNSLPDDVGFAYGKTLCAARTKANVVHVREPLKTDQAKIDRHEERTKENANVDQGNGAERAEPGAVG